MIVKLERSWRQLNPSYIFAFIPVINWDSSSFPVANLLSGKGCFLLNMVFLCKCWQLMIHTDLINLLFCPFTSLPHGKPLFIPFLSHVSSRQWFSLTISFLLFQKIWNICFYRYQVSHRGAPLGKWRSSSPLHVVDNTLFFHKNMFSALLDHSKHIL